MSKVQKQIEGLRELVLSLNVAIDKAENGSPVEDGYFIEKVGNLANRMGYDLQSYDLTNDEKIAACENTPVYFGDLSNICQSVEFIGQNTVDLAKQCEDQDYSQLIVGYMLETPIVEVE